MTSVQTKDTHRRATEPERRRQTGEEGDDGGGDGGDAVTGMLTLSFS